MIVEKSSGPSTEIGWDGVQWQALVQREGPSWGIRWEPAVDGFEPLADPEAALLAVLGHTTSLDEPYPRRPAHGGPDDKWAPKYTETGKWVTIGHRSARALLEMNQDTHDEAAAVANGVWTWRASEAEVNARTPEVIMRTRHWAGPPHKPAKILFNLFELIGFTVSEKKWLLHFGAPPIPVGGDRWGPGRG